MASERERTLIEQKNKQYRDATICSDQMHIVKKFDTVVRYLYPVLQNAPRKHGVLRDRLLASLFRQVEAFIEAGKSNQISKLYLCDAGLANLRYLLSFAAEEQRRILSKKQLKIVSIHIAECGAMLNAWIAKRR
jgi:hypothetical protein